MRLKLKKLVKDPFVVMIAVVVLVPAILVAYAISNQQPTQSSVNGVNDQADSSESSQAASVTPPDAPQPITEAEKPQTPDTAPPVAPMTATTAATPAAPVCDEAQKNAAQAARDAKQAEENRYHEQQKDKLRLVSLIYRRYWDEEMVRHQNALNQIDADFRAALAAANC